MSMLFVCPEIGCKNSLQATSPGVRALPQHHAARMCDDGTQVIRVCTFGGEGRCSNGAGEVTVAALRFLVPESGFEITSCSCLARCDRGPVAQLRTDGSVEEELDDARACARWLRRLGVSVDVRLRDAFDAGRRGADLEATGKMTEALNAYNRAFSLATAAGLGVKWRSRPSSVLRVQLAASAFGDAGGGTLEAARATPAQLAWLGLLMVSRSRVFSSLSAQRWPLAQRRALEDAQYAVQLAEVELRPGAGDGAELEVAAPAACDDGIPRAAAWERLAEERRCRSDHPSPWLPSRMSSLPISVLPLPLPEGVRGDE